MPLRHRSGWLLAEKERCGGKYSYGPHTLEKEKMKKRSETASFSMACSAS